MVRKLILINIAMFLIVNGVLLVAFLFTGIKEKGTLLNFWIYLPSDPLRVLIQPWSIITYMFVHEGIFHILFNLLWLYYLGNLFQEYLGNQKILRTYLFGGVSGGILYMLGMNIFPALRGETVYLCGASAGVMAVIVGIATLLPNYQIRIFFFDIKLKYIALFMVILSFIEIYSANPGGNLAHIGGAIAGYLYVRNLSKRTFFDRIEEGIAVIWNKLFRKNRYENKIHKTYTSYMRVENNRRPNQDEVDTILDKISKSGYDSLSSIERETLFKASKDDL